MSYESDSLKTVTDLLIAVTERADDIDKILIVGSLDNEIVCYTNCDPATAIGLAEIVKHLQLNLQEY